MIDHIKLHVADATTSKAFYEQTLAPLCYRVIMEPFPGGAAGPRPQYHPGYYGAFVLDPDGNNVEAVCHATS
jgi:catechol 2,3-dioxygenase-like lactoylglutathione lyase family enzyme